VLIIAALAVFALATQAIVWFLAPREEESAFVGPPRSDYTLTDFTLDALDEQGQHSFSMVAPRMARRQDDGSIYVSTPGLRNRGQ
jgi:lipopolysaccharide export system protein LptC